MLNIQDKLKCCGCHACYNICSQDAITMKEDEKGFKYPVIEKEKCVDCGLCEKVCPILNKTKVKNSPRAFAVFNKDEEIRKQSSSGGVFSLIAEYILNEKGVVFGAAFSEDFMVEHIVVENIDELYRLRTSKYVQSSIDETYKLAKKYLEEERKVLFTGTPCQINGLYSYLQKEYDNLFTQDIICHGVPSPKVWKKYLEFRKNDKSDKIKKINFRQKDSGWENYEVLIQFKDYFYEKSHGKDLFMNAFLRNACLRDSCYNCSFKDKNRISDITLGDFWGIDNILPEMNDNKGTSLVIVNSGKGQKLMQYIQNKVESKEVDFEEAIRYNSAMYMSVAKPKNRDDFFENLDKVEFDKLVNKYTLKPNVVRRIINKLKSIVKKLLKTRK